MSFGDAMEAVIDLHRPNWKPTSNTEQQWRSLLANHISATIGPMPIADVAAADIVAVLDRVWDSPELARRTARRISTTMKWAMGRGLRDSDPTEAAIAAMPKHRHRPSHHRALHHSDLPDALEKIRASQAATATKSALELMVLTATRPGEVRHAHWAEFDLDIATTAHGLRATFRSWCSDQGVPRDLAEMALGHAVSGVEGAYARSDMIHRRRPLMQQWANHINQPNNT